MQVLAATRDLISEQEWNQASRLSSIFSTSPRMLLSRWSVTAARSWSRRAEADRLAASLPPAGKAEYEKQYGKTARELLDAAKEKPETLAEISRRFSHTDAGRQAALDLARHCLDSNDPLLASLWFDRLLTRPATDPRL